MDTFLLQILLGYRNLPERAGDLWAYMEKIREEIAREETHKNRAPVLAHKYTILGEYELEFRNILISCRKAEVLRR